MANLGYLGHMWELYAMWTWLSSFLLFSFQLSGYSPTLANVTAFASIAAGGLGSLLAGVLADRLGRTTIAISALLVSGSCAVGIGFLVGGSPTMLIAVSLIWGFAVVADSAQFSAAISELGEPEYIGTALTLQTCLGFLLTLVTIRLVPALQSWVGWQWAFSFLALGPIVGILAMLLLRQSPNSIRLAGGRR